MNYAATIMARLGLDTKGFSDGIQRADGHTQTLLKSSARVGHQISNFARTLTSGASAADVFSVGLEGIGRSLKLSLGAISSLFVGGLIVGEIAKAAKEVTDLHNRIMSLGAADGNLKFDTFEQLKTHLQEIRVEMGKLKEAFPQAGHWVTFKQILNTISHPIDSIFGPDRDMAMLGQSNRATMKALADKAALENRLTRLKDSDQPGGLTPGAFAAERIKAFHDFIGQMKEAFFGKNMALAAEVHQKYALQIADITRKENLQKFSKDEKEKESMQLTLADIAKNGHEWAPGYRTGPGAGQLARKAIKEDELTRKAMLDENWEEARRHRTKSDQYKDSIGILKDSEKSEGFRIALAASVVPVLDQINYNTAQPIVNK
jgi:hypothetical protein